MGELLPPFIFKMSKQETRNKLEYLAAIEQHRGMDAMRLITFHVGEYRNLYGSDDFVEKFVCDYLEARRDRERED